jgi:hypothetical protein
MPRLAMFLGAAFWAAASGIQRGWDAITNGQFWDTLEARSKFTRNRRLVRELGKKLQYR